MARGTLRDRQDTRGGLDRSMRIVSLGSYMPRGRCVSPGSQHWSRRAAGWVFTCPACVCMLWENTGTKVRKLVLAARKTLRNDQDSPSLRVDYKCVCRVFRQVQRRCRAVVRRSALNIVLGELPPIEAARGLISLLKRILMARASVWVTTDGSPGLPALSTSASLAWDAPASRAGVPDE